MSKLKDNEVLALQQEVEAKKERVSKLKSKFAPETTCTYNGQNLHTKSQLDLVLILAELITKRDNFDKANKLAKTNFSFQHQGFSYDQWDQDILFLIDKINLKQMEIDLQEDIEFLDSLVSRDTKNKQKFDKLVNKYKE
jgi:hypothetical protein